MIKQALTEVFRLVVQNVYSTHAQNYPTILNVCPYRPVSKFQIFEDTHNGGGQST